VALRCWVLAGPLRMLDPDEAVTGLMAQRIARGQGYLYFAGQRYMGALEQYLQAPFAALAPGNALILRLPQLALSGVACALVYRIGRRLYGGRRAALAAWLFAAGPAFNLVYGVKSRGAYEASVVVGLLGLLIAVRHEEGRYEKGTAAMFGLCCGLAGWLSPTAAFLLVPALWWLLGAHWRGPVRAALAAVAGGTLGAVPLLAGWLRTGATSGVGTTAASTTFAHRLRGLADPVLAEFLGLRWRAGQSILPGTVVAVGVAALAVGWLTAACRRRRGLRALVLLRAGERRPVDLLLLTVPTSVALYLAAPYTWYTAEPRYLFALYPVLALGLAGVLPSRGRPSLAVGSAAVLLTAGLAVTTLATHRVDYSRDLLLAADYLHAAGERDVYADYQVAFPLDYYSRGRVVAVPYSANGGRFPDLARSVATASHVGYAVLDSDAALVAARLAAAGATFHSRRFGAITVFTAVRPARRPAQLLLSH